GQQERRLKRDLPPNVKWLGPVDEAQLSHLYRNARALIFPGEEDFGLTPIEAQASGRPGIALWGGGARETVTQKTGLFFYPQTAEALGAAVKRFVEAQEPNFSPAQARANAQRFSREAFFAGMRVQLDEVALGWER